MRSHGLPVLRANDVEKTIGQPLFHRRVKDLEELGSNVRLLKHDRHLKICFMNFKYLCDYARPWDRWEWVKYHPNICDVIFIISEPKNERPNLDKVGVPERSGVRREKPVPILTATPCSSGSRPCRRSWRAKETESQQPNFSLPFSLENVEIKTSTLY